MQGYNAWCRDDQSFDLREEYINFYSMGSFYLLCMPHYITKN